MSPKKLVLLSQAVGVLLLAALAPVSPASAQNYRQEDFPKPPSTAADCNAGRHWELVPRARCVCDGDLGHIPVSNDQPAACNQPRPTISVYRNPTSAVTGSGFTVSWTATDSWSVNFICTGVSPSSGIAGQAPQNGGTSASWNGTGARTPMTGGFSGTYGAVGSTSCIWTATGLGGTASTGDSFTVYCPPPPPDTADTVYSQNPVTCDVTSTTIPASPGSTPTGGTSTSTVPVTPAPVPTSSTVTQTCADYGGYGSGYITTVNGSVTAAGGTCSVNTPCPAGQTGGPIVTTLDVASGTTSQSGSCQTTTTTPTTPTQPTPNPAPSCLSMGMQGTYPDCGLCNNGGTDYPVCTPNFNSTTEEQDLPCTPPLVGTAGKQQRQCVTYNNGAKVCDPWLTTASPADCRNKPIDPLVTLYPVMFDGCTYPQFTGGAYPTIQVFGSQLSLYLNQVTDTGSYMLAYTDNANITRAGMTALFNPAPAPGGGTIYNGNIYKDCSGG